MFRTRGIDGQLGISIPNCWREVHKADNKTIFAARNLKFSRAGPAHESGRKINLHTAVLAVVALGD
jgi:hypothetical protein